MKRSTFVHGTRETRRLRRAMSEFEEKTGSERRTVKVTRLIHLRHRLNGEQTDHEGVQLNPWKKSGPAQWHRALVGCAAASMRYHDEIRVFSRLMAKFVVGNNQ
jgi:hypothetical protein